MTQGSDAFIFDMPTSGRTISVYQIDDDEPHSDEMEGLMHDWFIMQDSMQVGVAITSHRPRQ
jgi:hypothetical protein